jgi:hypothetical protein
VTYRPAIVASTDPAGVLVTDDIEGVQVTLQTPHPVSPTPAPTSGFCFPVDTAVALETAGVRIGQYVSVIVRDASATVVAEAPNRQTITVPAGDGPYTVEVESQPIKLYLRIEGGLKTTVDGTGRRIFATDASELRVGVRSFHEYPAGTITTTEDPRDVMGALSTLGSALKTTSPERSWPTLRGHPPLIELGEEPEVPPGLAATQDPQEVTIEVPPTLEAVYPVTSLAYYLNARVEPGEEPAILADGERIPLTDPDPERAAARALKQNFLLDCVVRTEGYYPMDLVERRAVEGSVADLDGVDFDAAALYEASLGERVRRYLDVPYEAVEEALPRWVTTADVRPNAGNVEHLPFVAADLGLVRCPTPTTEQWGAPAPQAAAIDDFTRGGSPSVGDRSTRLAGRSAPTDMRSPGGDVGIARGSSLRRADGESTRTAQRPEFVVGLDPTDSIEHVWVGDGYPIGAAKPTIGARKRRLDATPSGAIEVLVVSNSPDMRTESDVRELYGLRELVQFEVEVREDLTREELTEVLAEDRDFVHYVGHVTDEGLQCSDGHLDATTLDTVRTRAFVLNGCRSYSQGMALVDAGAIGGLVTLNDVGNEPATKVGRMLAGLLNSGFSLGGTLDILGSEMITGRQYMIVGDPKVTLANAKGGTPILLEAATSDGARYRLSFHGYPTARRGLGTIVTPHVATNTHRYLSSGHVADFIVTKDQVADTLRLERFPVRTNGQLLWSDSLDISNIR